MSARLNILHSITLPHIELGFSSLENSDKQLKEFLWRQAGNARPNGKGAYIPTPDGALGLLATSMLLISESDPKNGVSSVPFIVPLHIRL